MKKKLENLSGWGNYPVESCEVYRPCMISHIKEILFERQSNNYIAFGMGRSYGDTPLNKRGGVIRMNHLNRMLYFDPVSGILHAEAGVTLEEIISVFLPQGFFLPTTPGTKYVTLGGAIANDVHGKNHHKDGCISEFILDFTLLTGKGDILICSRQENPDIFWATIGGIGLTGIILEVRIKLIKVDTAYYDCKYEKASNIDTALELFAEDDHLYQYSVAWIDCLAKGSSLGRCVLMRANHATRDQVKSKNALIIPKKRKLNIPFNFPSFSLNQYSIKLFNSFYYGINRNTRKIVNYDSFFYPLDSLLNWNRMYGKKGFVQYQMVLPPETCREGLVQILKKLSGEKRSSFLAVLKSSGEQGKGLLSFPKKGYTLALDIPIKDQTLFPFLRSLDEIVIRFNGRVYLAKDSEISPEHFAIMYPRFKELQEIKKKVDPNNLFSSSQARRLKIMEV